MEDNEIVSLYWDRSEDAIAQTEKKYGKYLFTVARNILSDPEDIRECINDTYLAAWKSIPPHRPDRLGAYLSRIIRQISIDLFRRKSAGKRIPSEYTLSLEELGDSFPDTVTPEQLADAELLRETVNRFVRDLPHPAQLLFLRRYYFFDPVKKIAADARMKESTVKTLLYRTRQQLRHYLIKEGFDL